MERRSIAASHLRWEGEMLPPALLHIWDPHTATVVPTTTRLEDIEKFAHDHCVHIPDGFHQKRKPTAFDHAMHDIFVNETLHPMDNFATFLNEICHIKEVRDGSEVQVSELCQNPAMMSVVEKTAHAMKKFRPVREDWAKWAKQMHIEDLDDLDHEQEISPLERVTESQRRALTPLVAQSKKYGMVTKGRLGMPGWKRLLVALLMQSSDSRDLWNMHKDELLRQVTARDIEVTFRIGEPPQLHTSHEFLRHCFTEEEVEALEAIQAIEDEDEAGHPILATEDLADTTLAASHLGDALSHISLAHEIVVDSTAFNEMRSLINGADTVVNGKFEPMKLLGIGAAIVDESVSHHMGPLGGLKLAQDIVHLAQNSEELKDSVKVLQEYVKAKAFLGVGEEVVSNFMEASHVADLAEAAKDMGAQKANEARLAMYMVRGGDAAVKVASVWARLPQELCHSVGQAPLVHDLVGHTIAGHIAFGSVF